MTSELRKDHRLQLKLIEAKGVNRGEECDTYCHVRVWQTSMTRSSENLASPASDNDDTKSIATVNSSRKLRRSSTKNGDLVSSKAAKTKIVSKTHNPWFDDDNEFDLTDEFKEATGEFPWFDKF